MQVARLLARLPAGRSSCRRGLALLLVLVVSAGAYWNSLGNGFVWDDQLLIVQNASIKDWRALRPNLTSDFFYYDSSSLMSAKRGYYRPLVTLSYMVDYSIWGLHPAGYHLTNLIVHTLNAMLVFLTATVLLHDELAALLASLLFASHPVHTESVSWIAGRTDVIAALFFLASLYCYLRGRAEGDGAAGGRGWRAGAVAAFGASLLSKETTILLPGALGVYEFCNDPRGGRAALARAIRRVAPLAGAAVAYLVFRFGILRVEAPVSKYLAAMGRYALLVTFVKSLGLYLLKCFVPYPLSAYYSLPVSKSAFDPPVVVSALGLFGIGVATCKTAGPRLWPFIVALFLLAMVPVSNLIPIGAPKDMGFLMAERFLYIPSVAFCLFAALALVRCADALHGLTRFPRPAVVSAITVPLLAAYVWGTIARNRDWHDEKTFYLDTIAKARCPALIHFNLGLVYRDEGAMAAAQREMRKAITCQPSLSEAHNNLGNLLFLGGDSDGAIREWRQAVSLKPTNYEGWYNLGLAFEEKGWRLQALQAYQAFLQTVSPTRRDIAEQVRERVKALASPPRTGRGSP